MSHLPNYDKYDKAFGWAFAIIGLGMLGILGFIGWGLFTLIEWVVTK